MKRHVIGTFLCISLGAGLAMPAWADFDAGVKAYRQGEYATALREFKADKSPQATFYLSLMYGKGAGVRQSMEESVALLRKAAEQGLDVAQANLGIMYIEGQGVNQDTEEGLKWLRKSAGQGLVEAQMVLELASGR